MSSRGGGSYPNSPRRRDPYARDRPTRSRSRSPRRDRDRYDERDTHSRRDRDERYDRKRDDERDYRRNDRDRAPVERERDGNLQRGQGRSVPDRPDRSRDEVVRVKEEPDISENEPRERPRDERDRPRDERGGPRDSRGRPRDNHDREFRRDEPDNERPLDRRAIEEGRRRREEERARVRGLGENSPAPPGVRAVPTGPKRGVVAPREGGRDGTGGREEERGADSPYHEGDRDKKDTRRDRAERNGGERGDHGGSGEDEGREEGMEDEGEEGEDAMASMMGFGGFGTTKGKSGGPNADGGANVHKQRTWRQYMNRRGGFNRPLEKMK